MWCCASPSTTLVVAVLLAALTVFPAAQLGGEFLPPLDEGDLLYMPTALPGLSAGQGRRTAAADRSR